MFDVQEYIPSSNEPTQLSFNRNRPEFGSCFFLDGCSGDEVDLGIGFSSPGLSSRGLKPGLGYLQAHSSPGLDFRDSGSKLKSALKSF